MLSEKKRSANYGAERETLLQQARNGLCTSAHCAQNIRELAEDCTEARKGKFWGIEPFKYTTFITILEVLLAKQKLTLGMAIHRPEPLEMIATKRRKGIDMQIPNTE